MHATIEGLRAEVEEQRTRAEHLQFKLTRLAEELVCPVVMSADRLHELLAKAQPPASQGGLRERFMQRYGGQVRTVYVGSERHWFDQLDSDDICAWLDAEDGRRVPQPQAQGSIRREPAPNGPAKAGGETK